MSLRWCRVHDQRDLPRYAQDLQQPGGTGVRDDGGLHARYLYESGWPGLRHGGDLHGNRQQVHQ
jgi:hypothetical protein